MQSFFMKTAKTDQTARKHRLTCVRWAQREKVRFLRFRLKLCSVYLKGSCILIPSFMATMKQLRTKMGRVQ